MRPIMTIALGTIGAVALARRGRSGSRWMRGASRKLAATSASGGGGAGTPASRDDVSRIDADAENAPKKPSPKRVPHDVKFGVVDGEDRGHKAMNPPKTIEDDLFWLRDDERKSEEIMSHLREENAYTEAHTTHLKKLEDKVYDEIIKTIEETDEEVHFPWGDAFDYFVRTRKGKPYPIVCRCEKNTKKNVEIVLDVNEVAKDMKYCSLGGFKPSPTHDVLAYAVDSTGYETYEVRFKSLSTGKQMEDVLTGVAGGVSWGGGVNREVYYSTFDDAHRPHKVWRHVMGTPQSSDECVLHEPDGLFNVGFSRSSSGKFMILETESTETNEVYLIDLESDSKNPPEARLVQKRVPFHRYYLEHRGDKFFVLSNRDGKINFELLMTPVDAVGQENWVPLVDGDGASTFQYDEKRTLESFFARKNHLVIDGRENGFSAIWVIRLDETSGTVKDWHKTVWPSENALVYPSIAGETLRCVGANQIWDTDDIYVSYSSLVSPRTVYKYNMNSKEKQEMKTTPVKGFHSSQYTTMRVEVTARDGVKVPVSIAYRTDKRVHKGPLLLEGYGSYGISNDPAFMRTAVPLMDRGVTIAVAHIRGGGEMGRDWYEKQGKYLTKLNTFHDFIDVAEHLVSTGWTQTSKLAISGRSAGGLLMGATLNMRPDLFRCVVAGVPFVDVMVSMCDPSIPLTTGEWEEWGNPNEEVYFEYMLKYAPMENIAKSDKPDVLITAGLHDPRVAYWEAAKYAARLRDSVTNGARVLLKTDLSAGHFSASDRYQHFEQTAFEHAFTLECLGLVGKLEPKWLSKGLR